MRPLVINVSGTITAAVTTKPSRVRERRSCPHVSHPTHHPAFSQRAAPLGTDARLAGDISPALELQLRSVLDIAGLGIGVSLLLGSGSAETAGIQCNCPCEGLGLWSC